jgi:hypothetical protein
VTFTNPPALLGPAAAGAAVALEFAGAVVAGTAQAATNANRTRRLPNKSQFFLFINISLVSFKWFLFDLLRD